MDAIYKKIYTGSTPYNSKFEEGALWNILGILELYMKDNNCLEPDVIFETVVFNYPKNLSSQDFKTDLFWRKFDTVYRENCKTLVGRNYTRNSNRKYLPVGYAFIDFPHSKRAKKIDWKTKKYTANFRSGSIRRPHSHAIYIIPPTQKTRVRSWLKKGNIETQKAKLSDHLGVSIESIDRKRIPIGEDIFRTVRYSAALLRQHTPYLHKQDLWSVMPTFS